MIKGNKFKFAKRKKKNIEIEEKSNISIIDRESLDRFTT
jgi:hypothetical protein